MPSGQTFTHTHTHTDIVVSWRVLTHTWTWLLLGGGAQFHMHACVSVCVSGVRGEYRAGVFPVLEAVFQIYISFPPPFIFEDPRRGPHRSAKIKAGHSSDGMLTDSLKCTESRLRII